MSQELFTVDVEGLRIPENACYIAQDKNGSVWGYSKKPVKLAYCWLVGSGNQYKLMHEDDAPDNPLWKGAIAEVRHYAERQVTASDIMDAAGGHMQDRASSYDAPEGERSMSRTVQAFNAATGHSLSETDGWRFMEILKMVRSTQGDYRADNHEDATAYAALAGESAARE